MDFSMALTRLKAGDAMARAGWNGKGMFVYLEHGATFTADGSSLPLHLVPDGTEITYLPHIDMKTATGECVPWLASQTDILADDWERV